MKWSRNCDGAVRQPCLGYESRGSRSCGRLKERGMLSVRLLTVLCLASSVACASAEGTFLGSLTRAEAPSPIERDTRATSGATVDVPESVSPQAALSSAITLYE